MRPLLYYVHHHGLGHWRRAAAVAVHLSRPVLLASSAPPPWPLPPHADWLQLPLDAPADPASDVVARGRLHWVPLDHAGLLARHQGLLSAVAARRPALAVVDVSVEVTVLLRLCGVPVVAIRQPGRRDDAAHRLAYDVAEEVIMPVPPGWGLHDGLPRTEAVGLVCAPRRSEPPPRRTASRRLAVLVGSGGTDLDASQCFAIAEQLDDWKVVVVGAVAAPQHRLHNLRFLGHVDDPLPQLSAAEVVVGNAGLGTLGDVALARRPFVVAPAARPFDEQYVTARALVDGGHAVLASLATRPRWAAAVRAALALGPIDLPVDGAPRLAERLERLTVRFEPGLQRASA